MLILATDPLLTDSDANGIADPDEDFDADGLANLDEHLQKTEPFTADTDSDGLTDGEEVHAYGTDPLDSDTDDDKLIDGDEGESGAIYLQYGILFEPLQPDTDGNGILDGDEVFGQTLEQEIVTEDEVITQVTVDMETNGNIAQNLTIESMQDVDALSSNVVGLIGEPLEFTSATEFDSATISFAIDQSKLGDTVFDNLIILWYNEDEGIFEEMPTDRDRVNSTVSTTTTHFSQYLVVDSVKWYASWENSFRQMDDACGDDIVVEYPLHTYFLIDCSEEMGDVDPFNRRKTICQNIIDNMQSFDKASVATFSREIAFDSDLTSSKSTLNYYLSRINNDGSETNVAAALGPTLTEIYETIQSEPYRIIILTHGDADFNAVKAAMWQFDNQFENGTVNIINLSSSVMSEDAISFAQHSGGDVYYAAEAHELTTQVGTAITYPATFDNTDSDEDKIPDIVERYGLKPDGTLINSDPYKTDTDGDGLTDSEELGFVSFDAILHAPGEYLQHISYRSDPNNPDTDGDGYIDSLDNNPLIVITAEEIMLMEFCSNAEFYEISFLFGGPNGHNKGFLTSYPDIIDRIKVIEVLRRHTFSTDQLSYYQDLQDAGFIHEIVPDKWGKVEYLGFDLMLYNFELASVNLSLAALSQIAYENWSNDIKLAASIWLFGISDRYCRQMAVWDYTYEYKLSLQQEQTVQEYIKSDCITTKVKGVTQYDNIKINQMPETDIAQIAGDIRKNGGCPISIPENATIKASSKVGYEQISYKWSDASGIKFEARWHTQTPGAPATNGTTWVVQKTIPGTSTGQQKAIIANSNGTATIEQLLLLESGHWAAK